MYYASSAGCIRGKSCPFLHQNDSVTKKPLPADSADVQRLKGRPQMGLKPIASGTSNPTTGNPAPPSAICSDTSGGQRKLWVMGGASFAPTAGDRGEESRRTGCASCTSENKSGGNFVQWRSSRQDLIAKSTCEAELVSSSETLQQGESIAIVATEITNRPCEIEVSSDNATSLHMIRNGSETAWRTRHISVKALWMHQMARRGIKFTSSVHHAPRDAFPLFLLSAACFLLSL